MFNFFKKEPCDLTEHTFFSNINYWVNIGIDKIPINNPIKKRVVSKFLKIKFLSYDKHLKEFIKKTLTITKECDIVEIQNLLINIVKDYEDEINKKGIPDIFIEKFKKLHENNLQIIFDAIGSICTSKFYDSLHEKMAAILDILLFSFRVTFTDVEQTINEINGEIESVLKGSIFDI